MNDTDRQQEDKDRVAQIRTMEYGEQGGPLGAITRNFHLRLSRLELALVVAYNSHACVPGDCGICKANGILNGERDWDLEDRDYELPEPPAPPQDPIQPFHKSPKPEDLGTVEDAERSGF